ncbi:hypothetical protein VKT23_011616 [Stygiomarasmius scandens]|uniref:Uncharacterized protein n=1 Tax=Marasmiellus scandens TaxID=2682957 RepID=A0ABR1JEC2_9AGAR
MFLHLPPFGLEAVKLAFNLIFVKPCLFVFFQVHGNATKWKIALETSPETEPYPKGDKNYYENTRLEFNANPRFLVSSRDSKFGPTGLPANVIMAIALAITYAASQMVLLELEDNDDQGEPASNAVLPHFAFHVLGVVILIQAFLSIWALVACRGDIKTWNASPFATAYILSQELGRVRRIPGRFMQSLYHRYRDSQSVVQPTSTSTKSIWRKLGRCRLESLYHYIRGSQHEMKSEVVQIVQMSAWDSHPIFRSLTMWVWMLIGSGFFWGILIYFMVQSGTPGTFRGTSWVPVSEPSNSTSTSGSSVLNLGWDGVAPISGLVWGLAILVGFQGGIVTTAMTCAQTILDLACDQRLWMEIRGKGSDPNPHMFRKLMICWHSWVLHIADPLFHWLFGLAVNISADKGLQVKPVPVCALLISIIK